MFLTTAAQVPLSPAWEDYLQQYVENDENCEEPYDQIQYLYENPVNLNDTHQLSQLFFLTHAQKRALKRYVTDFGQLLSPAELHLINGFDSLTIALMLPIISTEPFLHQEPLTLKNIISHANHKFLTGSRFTLEKSKGYLNNAYAGDPFRLYFLYQLNYHNKINIQFSGDKDPGEKFDGRGFDFYNFHLSVNNIQRIKRLIIGRYRLQFGQGLTLWTGAHPWGGPNGTLRNAQQIVNANSFAEQGFLQGIATTMELNRGIELTAFYSNDNIDATKATSTCVQSISHSGLHRTQTEQSKRDVLNEQLCGLNLNIQRQRLSLGTTMQVDWFNKAIYPERNLYNYYSFSGKSNMVLGIDACYQVGQADLYGELAHSVNSGWAGLMGAHCPLGNGTQVNIFYRNYARDFENLHAAAHGQNSTNQNEEGLNLSIRHQVGGLLTTQLEIDHFRHPWMQYQTYGPSTGNEIRATMEMQPSRSTRITMSYRYKEAGHNAVDSTVNHRIVEQGARQTLKVTMAYGTEWLRLRSEVVASLWQDETSQAQEGLLVAQHLTLKREIWPVAIESHFAIFDVDGYDAAIRCLENDLYYESPTMTCYHKGLRFYVLARYAIGRHLDLAMKYSITAYADQETIGSGHDAIASNKVQNLRVQLRCRW